MTIFSNVAVNNFTQNTCGIDGITGKVILQYNITDTYCIEQKKTISYLQYLRGWDENWRMKWMRGRPGWGMCWQSTQSWCADHWVWPLFDLGTLGGRRYQAICLHLYVQRAFMHCVHVSMLTCYFATQYYFLL